MSTRRRKGDGKKLKSDVDWTDVEQILFEAEIVARWSKNPFYIS